MSAKSNFPPETRLVSAVSRPDLWERAFNSSSDGLWIVPPWFIDSGVLKSLEDLGHMEELAAFQTMVVSGADEEIIAVGQCLPFYWPEIAECGSESADIFQHATTLPDGGWQTMFARGMSQANARRGGTTPTGAGLTNDDHRGDDPICLARDVPNALCALIVMVRETHMGNGISGALLQNFVILAKENDLKTVVVPLRPYLKSDYPHVPMEEYLTWAEGKPHEAGFKWADRTDMTDIQPLPFDPWLRKHVRMGGRIAKLAPRSFIVEAPASTWQKWLGDRVNLDIIEGGDGKKELCGKQLDGFIWEGELVGPLEWDSLKKVGRYIEQDIWVMHFI